MKVYVVNIEYQFDDEDMNETWFSTRTLCVASSLDVAKEMAQSVVDGVIHWAWWEKEPHHYESGNFTEDDTLFFEGHPVVEIEIEEVILDEYVPTYPLEHYEESAQ